MGTTADKLEYLQGTKAAIKQAIVNKGVDVPDGTTFREYAGKIAEISGGGGTNHTITNLDPSLYEVAASALAGEFVNVVASGRIFDVAIMTDSGEKVGYVIDGTSMEETLLHFFMPADNVTIE